MQSSKSQPLKPKSPLALFLPSLEAGGAERVMLNLAAGFSQAGYPVDMLLAKGTGAYLSELPSGVRLVNLKARRMLESLPRLAAYLRSTRPCALLAALDLADMIAVLAGRLAAVDTRTLVSVHNMAIYPGMRSPKSRLENALISWSYRRASGVIAVSHSVAQDLIQKCGVPSEKIRVIYNPVITPQLHLLSQGEAPHPFFQPGQPPVILGAGRLAKVKDFPTLLRAYALVRQERPARLVILGEGEQRAGLERLAQELGITEGFALPGFISNPYAWMRKAAVFVSSSANEGFSNVLIEALACGCPVVSTDCPGGPAEILENGRYGRLTPVGDAEAMAKAILQTLNGQADLVDEPWKQRFTLKNSTQQYLDVLLA
jgi:glycosyltransferase involved in cell wall biosynthesis